MKKQWSAASIRVRLTGWYTVALSVMLVIYAAATFLAVRREFQESLDEQSHELRVSGSEDRMREQLAEVLKVLVLGLPLVIVVAGVGGYLLAGRALVPMELSFDRLRRFTADASHELRTPLAVIRGIGEAGLVETRTPAEYKEAIGSMLEEIDRLTTLVDTLLRLSHGDAGTVHLTREPLDLGQLTREVAGSLAVLAEERRQRITVEAAAGVSVNADRLVLREAVINVIDNAIKYSPEGASITVTIRARGDEAMVEVADHGPGVSADDRQRIFDRFFRVDTARSREAGGSGLGLAIAKWAVEVNGGSIAVEAGAAGGSVFRISLPRGNT